MPLSVLSPLLQDYMNSLYRLTSETMVNLRNPILKVGDLLSDLFETSSSHAIPYFVRFWPKVYRY